MTGLYQKIYTTNQEMLYSPGNDLTIDLYKNFNIHPSPF